MEMGDTFDSAKVRWVLDESSWRKLIEALKSATLISYDLETTGLNEYKPTSKIVMASYTVDDGETWVLPLFHPESAWLGRWRKMYRETAQIMRTKFLVAHNGKFDCRWTWRMTGVDLSGALMWDSRVSAHSLDENRSTKLKERAPDTFGIERWDDFDLDYEGAALDIPLIDLGLYAARDTYWTWKLTQQHRYRMFAIGDETEPPVEEDEIEDARLGQLAEVCLMPTTRTLTAIEQRGFLLDEEWVREAIAEWEAERDPAFEWLVARYADEPEHECEDVCHDECPAFEWPQPERASFAPTSKWFIRWTQIAVERGDLRIAAMTKGGKPQWSKNVLIRQQRTGSEVAEKLLTYRGAVKKLEYLNSWLNYQRDDGAIHAQYNVGSLITGRLSSSEPNMQQITKALKPAFVPRPGYVIADLDYSQIELRVAAFISRCEAMIEAFQRGDDLHRILAANILQTRENKAAAKEGREPRAIALDEVSDEDRQAGKSANFGLLYLMGAVGFREYAENVYDVSFTIDEAEEIHQTFFDTWDGMRQWHQRVIGIAHAKGQVVSPIGRVRRVPGIHQQDGGRSERQAVNSPVQGFASDLMQMAAASIEGKLPGHEPVKRARLVATVHDSIVAEVPEDCWEEVVRECIERMVGVTDTLKLLGCDFDVPLIADANVGSRWGLKDIGSIS